MRMEVPSAKRHSVFASFGLVLTTCRRHTFGRASALGSTAMFTSTRTLAPANSYAK